VIAVIIIARLLSYFGVGFTLAKLFRPPQDR
jgi:hypothetical protein